MSNSLKYTFLHGSCGKGACGMRDDIVDILRCPITKSRLRLCGDSLVNDAGVSFPIVNGKPILVRCVEPHHITPPSDKIISKNIQEFTLFSQMKVLKGFKLHLGCGDVPSYDSDVISVDVIPTSAADVVCEAESLPFADDSLACVVSGAVFEHVFDPVLAAREVRRVLRPLGEVYIDTAFLQGYHGFPSHYFNMTPQAIETVIIDDLELISSGTPLSGTPWMNLTNIIARLLQALPQQEQALITDAERLRQTIENNMSVLDQALPEHIRRSLATSFAVYGRKPSNYDPLVMVSEEKARICRQLVDSQIGH